MSNLKGVLLAIELATRQRDEAAQVSAKAKRALEFARDQMAQLESYAGDTDARWTGSASVARSGELIRHHYQFMDRLQQAILLQSDVIRSAGHQVELADKGLLQAEFRLAGLNQVLKARQAALDVTQRRREQRLTDEFASLQHARTRAQFMNGET